MLDLNVPDSPPGWGNPHPGILSGQGGILALPLHPAKDKGNRRLKPQDAEKTLRLELF